MKVRVRELLKYREHGLTKQSQLIPFERLRFKRELKLKHRRMKGKAPPPSTAKFLPTPGIAPLALFQLTVKWMVYYTQYLTNYNLRWPRSFRN